MFNTHLFLLSYTLFHPLPAVIFIVFAFSFEWIQTKRIPLLVFTLSNILILMSFLLRIISLSINYKAVVKNSTTKSDSKYNDGGRSLTQGLLTDIEDSLLTMALPLSWFFLIFFAGGMKLTGAFVSMIRYMLIQDMRQFSVIYLIFIYAFSQGWYQ